MQKPKPKRGGKRPGAGRPPSSASKRTHLHIRLTAEQRSQIEHAASAQGATVTDYVIERLGL